MQPSPLSPFRKRGIALVIVLAFLALIASLVIAYFTSVSNELSVSKSYAVTTDTKTLSDTAVELVTSQIRDATVPLPKGAPFTWTSQPGMIRVFGTPAAASSQPYAYYKLYSSDVMVITKDFKFFKPEDDVAKFVDSPDLFTDLNKPVLVQDDTGLIVGPDSKRYRADYPIFDPSSVPVPTNPNPPAGIEGISLGAGTPGLTAPPKYTTATGTIPPAPTYNPVLNPNPAPMPVRWIYVLRDGSMAVPTDARDGLSNFGGSTKPTKDNPIVGRIAFWADDECSKLNINTASEATYWDTPLTASYADSVAPALGLGNYQPSAGEYQRYPGHPATTCLSPVFGRAFGWLPPPTGGITNISYTDPSYNALKEAIYSIVPRVNTGGSMEGTITAATSTAVPVENDRLYSSVDELLYRPAMNAAAGGNFPTRQYNLRMNLPNTQQFLRQTRFFLTANNRAPELNLFGRPRISIWPVAVAEASRSAKDNVFAFCSTIGSKTLQVGKGFYPYYFTRSDPRSETTDYLDAASPRNGRNTVLYSYLQDLTSKPIPGFGQGNFLKKYADANLPAPERDQILTEMFDYIRCINLSDGSNTGGNPYTPPYANNGSDYAGQITPIKIGNTRGFGRFPTLSEAAIIFTMEPRGSKTPTTPDRMRATLVLEMFTPSFGWIGMKDTYAVRVDSPSQTGLTITDPTTGAPVDLLPASATNIVTCGVHAGPHGRFLGGHLGFGNQFFYGASSSKKVFDRTGSNVESKYPFVSDWINVPLPVNGQPLRTFDLRGTITVSILPVKNPTAGTPAVQTITINFPTCKVRVPTQNAGKTSTEFEARIGAANNTDTTITTNWIIPEDAVRSIEAKTDLRLIAGRSVVTNGFGQAGDPALNRWTADMTTTANTNVIHSLHTALGPRYVTAVKTGVLVAQGSGPTYTYPNYKWDASNPAGKSIYKSASDNQARMTDLPEELRGGVRRFDGNPGDWDSGVSKMYDGPFINKTDEGESSDGSSIPYFLIADFKGAVNTLYSPNRIIASPGWFGSLPTGVMRNHPWETLLFRPDRTNHPGLADHPSPGDPPDHLWLDFFNMPVVEPYPISEPFSQAGKVNMNYQIIPFGGYLKRDTALRGVLRAEKMLCIPFGCVNGGKTEAYDSSTTDYRHQIDEDVTLAFLERRWKDTVSPQNQVFRSASQICELDLYPKPNADTASSTGMPVATLTEARGSTDVNARWQNFWDKLYSLTGDNARERPYARLYSRLTTKSNTYTVHLRVQTLAPNPASKPDVWDETKSTILGDYRGSAVIERYLDPADRRFNPADPTTPASEKFNPDTDSLEAAYRFRVLTTKQFAP